MIQMTEFLVIINLVLGKGHRRAVRFGVITFHNKIINRRERRPGFPKRSFKISLNDVTFEQTILNSIKYFHRFSFIFPV